MKACILYRPQSEFARMVEDYVRDFKRTKNLDIELIDLNTREGDSRAKLYDIMQYPCLMILQENGQLIKHWQGEHFPLMNELAVYLHQ